MTSASKIILLLLFFLVTSHDSAIFALGKEDVQKIRAPPNIDMTIEDAGIVGDFSGISGSSEGFGARVHTRRVSVLSVALITLAMALATGFGALPFFFVDLDAHWAGVCNGLAAGVMLAASFGLIQEGQANGSTIWVMFGIVLGGIFICLCKKFLEQCGEMSMLDIKGADASKVVLVIGIMTLHSFGEGSGVGVSFAGTKGLSQGLVVTLAIAVHNIPEGLAVSLVLASRGVSAQKALLWSIITSLPQPIVAVPSFLCAETFNKFLPFCTGFAAGCMIWMVIAEVIPDAFKDAPPSQVASAGTVAVAFMETLSMVIQNFSSINRLENAYGFFVSLLFGLGPLLGGLILVSFAVILCLRHTFLMGMASGIAFLLSIWRPLQLIMSSNMAFITVAALLATGVATSHMLLANILKLTREKKAYLNKLSSPSAPTLSVLTIQSFLACGALSLHALAEGLAVGVAAPKAYGLGRHMVLPVSLHGLPRGAAVASCIYGALGNSRAALAAATLTGFAGPLSAIASIIAGIDYSGLDYWMVFACGALLPSFWNVFKRSVMIDKPGSVLGLLMGLGSAYVCMMSTRLMCLFTPYCNLAPEAVT